MRTRRLRIPEEDVAKSIARATGIASCSVSIEDGSLGIDAACEDGSQYQTVLRPRAACFAPGGPKEISFTVVFPENGARQSNDSIIFAAVAETVALALWRGAVSELEDAVPCATIDHVQRHVLVDLRTTAAARALTASPLAFVGELTQIQQFAFEDRAIVLELRSTLRR